MPLFQKQTELGDWMEQVENDRRPYDFEFYMTPLIKRISRGQEIASFM